MKAIGSLMKESEVKEFSVFALTQTSVKGIITELNKYTTISEEELGIFQAFKWDLGYDGEVSANRAIIFKGINSESYILFLEKTSIEGDAEPQYITVGSFASYGEDSVEVTQIKINHEGEVSQKTNTRELDTYIHALEDSNNNFFEDFPLNEDYYPGQLKEMVKSADAMDGCLVNYIWCGQACTSKNCSSSSAPKKNALDNCCRIHDCCYIRYGAKRPHCYCDQQLCDCAQGVFPTGGAWNTIVQACFCFVC